MKQKNTYNHPFIVICVSVFLLFSIHTTSVFDASILHNPATLYVDDEYTSETPGWNDIRFCCITDAMTAAQPHDTIFIYDGIYPESFVIEKPLRITGESQESVIINGTEYISQAMIHIRADQVHLSNLTIRGRRKAHYPREHAINNTGDETILTHLHVENTDYPITLDGSQNNTISHNTIDNYLLDGIQLKNAHNNLIENNTIHGSDGITTKFSNNNIIRNNYVEGLEGYVSYAIYMYDSKNNLVYNNTIITTLIGFFISRNCENNSFLNNDVEINNYDMCGFYLESVYNCIISGNTIHGDTTSGQGIWMTETTNTEISNNQITRAQQGILIQKSSDNNLTNNTISEHIQGITMKRSNHNHVQGNRIMDNFYGIKISLSKRNMIYNNIFSNEKNTETDVFGLFSLNTWNIKKTPGENIIGGSYLGGNYWSGPRGYTGEDTNDDGIGERWYRIGIMGIDFAPLVHNQ